MIRKLLFPALAIALLGGCVSDYQYRGGYGDYYYGQPSVQYDDYGYGGFYGDPYGFGGYGYPSYLYGGYGYPYGGYGYPYYPPYYPHRRPGHHGGGHDHGDHDGDHDHDDHDGDDDHGGRPKPPWRDLTGLRPREPRPALQPGRPPVMVPATPRTSPYPSDGRRQPAPVGPRVRDRSEERDARRKHEP